MIDLDHVRPTLIDEAVAAVSEELGAVYLAGGSNLIDHLKLGLLSPSRLVDVGGLGLDDLEETEAGGLRIGANVRNSDLAAHPAVLRDRPVLARALLAGASGQIRNQATTAGNLLQRTRCVYFQDVTTPCNKREPGSGCSADHPRAHTKDNAVFGSSPTCRAVHPGDMSVALAALDAVVVVRGPGGERRLGLDDLYRLPGDHPERDTTLEHGDLVTAVELPAPIEGAQGYHKVRDRASFAFALASVAAILRMDGETVADVRVAWGSVAHRPWRARTLEERLTGRPLTEETVREACAAELADAPTDGGGAKTALVTGATVSLLLRLAAGDEAPLDAHSDQPNDAAPTEGEARA